MFDIVIHFLFIVVLGAFFYGLSIAASELFLIRNLTAAQATLLAVLVYLSFVLVRRFVPPTENSSSIDAGVPTDAQHAESGD
jgi:membrane protein implicated in regulation of membrane protease activity